MVVPRAHLDHAEQILAAGARSVSIFRHPGVEDEWRLEVLYDHAPPIGDLARRLAREIPHVAGEFLPVERIDWVKRVQAELKTVAAGRFYLHGGHDRPHPAPNRISLRIEAGAAFGSGHHETTRGSLLAIDHAARRRRIATALDVGAGSGVLALALARAAKARVLAVDIDPMAVTVTRDNARLNGLGPWIRARRADGARLGPICGGRRFDLVAANILARPLIDLAPVLARRVAPGGMLVLSGLLGAQQQAVRAAYRRHGLILAHRFVLGDWPTLCLKRQTRA